MVSKLILDQDPEGDEDMSNATAPFHGEEESDSMFPAANDSSTMLNTQNLADHPLSAGELSPPYSQDPPPQDDEIMDTSGGDAIWEPSSAADLVKLNENTGNAIQNSTKRSGDNYKPGAWDTPRAREEAYRHWNGLLDKSFSLSE